MVVTSLVLPSPSCPSITIAIILTPFKSNHMALALGVASLALAFALVLLLLFDPCQTYICYAHWISISFTGPIISSMLLTIMRDCLHLSVPALEPVIV